MYNRKLYSKIMENVSKQVKKVLNEDIVADDIRKTVTDSSNVLIVSLVRRLQKGAVKFSFVKRDGSNRIANGTTNPDIVRALAQTDDDLQALDDVKKAEDKIITRKTGSQIYSPVVRFFDMDKREWRACNIDRLENIEIIDQKPAYEVMKDIDVPSEVTDAIRNLRSTSSNEPEAKAVQQEQEPKVFMYEEGGDEFDNDETTYMPIVIGGLVRMPSPELIASDDDWADEDDQYDTFDKFGGNEVHDDVMKYVFQITTKKGSAWVWVAAHSISEATDILLAEWWGIEDASLYDVEAYTEGEERHAESLRDHFNVSASESDQAFQTTDPAAIETVQNETVMQYEDPTIYDFTLSEGGNATPDTLKRLLNTGVVHFHFEKKDGSDREAYGTTSMEVIPQDFHPKGSAGGEKSQRNYSNMVIRFFDIIAKGWRSCRIENIK